MDGGQSVSWWQRALIGAKPRRTLLRIVILVGTSLVVFKFILLPVRVVGGSMEPTYKNGGVNFINRLPYLFHEPHRGDIVGIRLADEHVMFLKRIVALPGETVSFHRGKLIVNGIAQEEPYLKTPCDWEQAPEQVKTGKYYVVVDNRAMAEADHMHGQAERIRIVGKVLL